MNSISSSLSPKPTIKRNFSFLYHFVSQITLNKDTRRRTLIFLSHQSTGYSRATRYSIRLIWKETVKTPMRRIMSLLTITFQELKMIHVTTDVFITQVAAIFSQESFRTPENGSISRPV